MRNLSISFILMSALNFPLNAVQIIPIKDHESSEIEVSTFEHTRISVEGDRIAQLFGIDGRLAFEVDELNGQVFITPSPELKGSSVLITVTTEKGLTHDLRIKPTQKPADAILLRPKSQQLQGTSSSSHDQSYETSLLEFVKVYSQGKDHESYRFTKLENKIVENLSPDLEIEISTELHSSQFIGKVCQVKNTGDHPLLISPHHFAKYQPLAISFTKRDLKSSEHTEVLLILKRMPL